MSKRAIAYGATGLVTVMALAAVYIDHRREPTFDRRLKAHAPPVVLQCNDPLLAVHLAGAVDDIHRALGGKCPVFVIDSEAKEPDVIVTWTGVFPCGKPEDAPKTAHMSLYPCGHIVVQQAMTETQARLDFGHELGHVLALAHDDTPGSIMNSPPEYRRRPAPALTPKDVKAIKARLGCP